MEHSAERILTTHMGSLPRGDTLADLLIGRDSGETIDEATLNAEIDLALRRAGDPPAESRVGIGNDGPTPRVSF